MCCAYGPIRGIGVTYAMKASRDALRLADSAAREAVTRSTDIGAEPVRPLGEPGAVAVAEVLEPGGLEEVGEPQAVARGFHRVGDADAPPRRSDRRFRSRSSSLSILR